MEYLVIKRWLFWILLYLIVATSFVSVMIAWQMGTIRAQNRRSIEDRIELHRQNRQSMADRAHLNRELKETRASLRRLEDFVDRVVADEKKRRERQGR